MTLLVSNSGVRTGWAGLAACAVASLLLVSPAMAQDETAPALILPSTATETEAETPWYEAFTLSMNETSGPLLNETSSVDIEFNEGRWGFTLGFDQALEDERFPNEDVSAGAFVNFGDRFRIGGEVRFTAPEDDLFRSTEDDDQQPEVKFESALRF